MEWLPKFYDTLDSLYFELRMRWAGQAGQAVTSLVLFVAVLLLSATSPVFRNLVIAAIASFMAAELGSDAVAQTRPRGRFVTRRSAAI
ncbi:MAG: hypothetical protein ACE5G3_01960 [Gammaproteobacteria bacterium]